MKAIKSLELFIMTWKHHLCFWPSFFFFSIKPKNAFPFEAWWNSISLATRAGGVPWIKVLNVVMSKMIKYVMIIYVKHMFLSESLSSDLPYWSDCFYVPDSWSKVAALRGDETDIEARTCCDVIPVGISCYFSLDVNGKRRGPIFGFQFLYFRGVDVFFLEGKPMTRWFFMILPNLYTITIKHIRPKHLPSKNAQNTHRNGITPWFSPMAPWTFLVTPRSKRPVVHVYEVSDGRLSWCLIRYGC